MSTNTEDKKKELMDDKELDSVSGGAVPYIVDLTSQYSRQYRDIVVTIYERESDLILNGRCPNCPTSSLVGRQMVNNTKRLNYGVCEKCRTRWTVLL